MAHQQSNLVWYHQAGGKVLELQKAVGQREPGWTRGLAAALGLADVCGQEGAGLAVSSSPGAGAWWRLRIPC